MAGAGEDVMSRCPNCRRRMWDCKVSLGPCSRCRRQKLSPEELSARRKVHARMAKSRRELALADTSPLLDLPGEVIDRLFERAKAAQRRSRWGNL